jgi:hypothetical protein
MKKFKDAFDEVVDKDISDHQDEALRRAKLVLKSNAENRFEKFSQVAINVGRNPNEVGKTLANIIKVVLARVPQDRTRVYNIMKEKIHNLNVAEIANTKMPGTATYGQAITLIKTLLNFCDVQTLLDAVAIVMSTNGNTENNIRVKLHRLEKNIDTMRSKIKMSETAIKDTEVTNLKLYEEIRSKILKVA